MNTRPNLKKVSPLARQQNNLGALETYVSAGRLSPRKSAASGQEKAGFRVFSRARDSILAAPAQAWFGKAVSVFGGVHDEMEANAVRNPISKPKGGVGDQSLLYPSSPCETFCQLS